MTQNIQFEIDENKFVQRSRNPHHTGMIHFLVRNGIVRSKQGASFILLCIALVFLFVSFLVLSESLKEKVTEYQPDPETFL